MAWVRTFHELKKADSCTACTTHLPENHTCPQGSGGGGHYPGCQCKLPKTIFDCDHVVTHSLFVYTLGSEMCTLSVSKDKEQFGRNPYQPNMPTYTNPQLSPGGADACKRMSSTYVKGLRDGSCVWAWPQLQATSQPASRNTSAPKFSSSQPTPCSLLIRSPATISEPAQ